MPERLHSESFETVEAPTLPPETSPETHGNLTLEQQKVVAQSALQYAEEIIPMAIRQIPVLIKDGQSPETIEPLLAKTVLEVVEAMYTELTESALRQLIIDFASQQIPKLEPAVQALQIEDIGQLASATTQITHLTPSLAEQYVEKIGEYNNYKSILHFNSLKELDHQTAAALVKLKNIETIALGSLTREDLDQATIYVLRNSGKLIRLRDYSSP